jgi:hypothetical protein
MITGNGAGVVRVFNEKNPRKAEIIARNANGTYPGKPAKRSWRIQNMAKLSAERKL